MKTNVLTVLVAMKPRTEKTYLDQCLNNGHGVTWLDDCRIPFKNDKDKTTHDFNRRGSAERSTLKDGDDRFSVYGHYSKESNIKPQSDGRFPSNLLVSDDSLNDGKNYRARGNKNNETRNTIHFNQKGDKNYIIKPNTGDSGSYSRYFDLDKWYDNIEVDNNMEYEIYNKDCIEGMKELKENSIDLIVTDPPYGMKFMGKHWDKALPPVEAFEQMLRVLKPGAFAFVMCAPRSDLQARMSILLEDAGFNIAFTPIYWTFATGFPKAQNMKKVMDKKNIDGSKYDGAYAGYQPKPAVEVVIVAMKPRVEKTYLDQCLSNGHGVTWLDECRIPYKKWDYEENYREKEGQKYIGDEINNNFLNALKKDGIQKRKPINPEGRFPANLLVSDDTLNDGIERKTGDLNNHTPQKHGNVVYGKFDSEDVKQNHKGDSGSYSRYFDLDAWFAIIPKPSKKEKNQGCEHLPDKQVTNQNKYYENDYRKGNGEKTSPPKKNNHPTVKPIKLMSYLITLGSRPGDVILDPFMGSGTTGISAKLTGRNFIGYEMELEYYIIAGARINAWKTGTVRQDKERRSEDKKDGKKQSDGKGVGQISLENY